MKSKYLTTIVIIIAVIALGSSGGRSGSFAGAPGDQGSGNCGNCHGGGSTDGNITLTGLPVSMQPNTTYQMTVTLNDADATAGGFQILATDGGSNNTLIGSFNTTAETKLNDVSRLVQNSPKSLSGGSVSWVIEWVSPAVVPASNQVKFYLAGNAVNLTGSTTGDATYVTTSSLISLPVELIAFNGKSFDNSIELEWATATETNNKGFEVQKSANGQDWEVIGFLEGNGTTIESQVYKFVDETPFDINYYRLKQQDFDGKFEYSKIVRVEGNYSSSAIKFFPNPSIDKITFSNNITSTIRLYNLSGQLIREYTELQNNSIDVSTIQKGIYFLVFDGSNGKQQTEKITIIK